MNNPNTNLNNEDTLKLLEKFGFKFFSFDENGGILVLAPNAQVVQLSVAYDFVKSQIEKSQNAAGGSLESMPNMPTQPQILDNNFEAAPEKENAIEKATDQQNQSQNPVIQVDPPQKKIEAKPQEAESPFGDGFNTPINPVHIDKAVEFIKNNSRKSLSSTSKWLSIQFEKFIKEQELTQKP